MKEDKTNLRVWVKVLERDGRELVDSLDLVSDGKAAFNKDALVFEGALLFARRVENELTLMGCPETLKEFFLVFGESLEDAFCAFLSGMVADELDKLAACKAEKAGKQAANAHGEGDECNVGILVYPCGKPCWYDAYVWGEEGKPSYAGELAVRIFNKDRFEDFKKWCSFDTHAAESTTAH